MWSPTRRGAPQIVNSSGARAWWSSSRPAGRRPPLRDPPSRRRPVAINADSRHRRRLHPDTRRRLPAAAQRKQRRAAKSSQLPRLQPASWRSCRLAGRPQKTAATRCSSFQLCVDRPRSVVVACHSSRLIVCSARRLSAGESRVSVPIIASVLIFNKKFLHFLDSH